MAITKKQKECVHSFQATSGKAVMKVQSVSNNMRGKPKPVDVVSTVFKCSKCGAKKLYPDTWERGFSMIPAENS